MSEYEMGLLTVGSGDPLQLGGYRGGHFGPPGLQPDGF